MKYPVRLTETTPYYEKFFVFCEETPHAYVSAFREAQFEMLGKRRSAYGIFTIVVIFSTLAWLLDYVPFVLALSVWAGAWAIVSWRNRHESKLLVRTFELALRDKDREFQDYMWRHLDRRLMMQGL